MHNVLLVNWSGGEWQMGDISVDGGARPHAAALEVRA
jgi:hypothetical protein